METQTERLPRSRPVDELIVEELPDELLVYDRVTNKAHCLNRPAALVWRRCDGETSFSEALALLESEGLPRDPRLVELAVVELRRARLVEDDAPPPSATDLRSRRDALKRIGVIAGIAIALPIVESIVAPTVAAAASCVPSGKTCNQGQPCCSGFCGPGKKCL